MSPHFTARELACRHCGKTGAVQELFDVLEIIREKVGKPVIVTSGYRCKDHPETIKRPNSMHAQGRAADIRVKDMSVRELYGIVVCIPEIRGSGYDEYGGYVHVDIREGPVARWTYDAGGKPISV